MTTLTTKRFTLRPFKEQDTQQFEYASDESWRKYLFHTFPDRDQFVANCISSEDGFDLVVVDEEDQIIGSVHLGLGAPSYVGELACMISPDRWGEGVALEVCEALLEHAFVNTKLHKAIAHCEARNTGSWKVLEKLGMAREGTLRENRLARDGNMVDEYCYGLLRADWDASKQN